MSAFQSTAAAPLSAGETRELAAREAASPRAAAFEGGGAALAALLGILFVAALVSFVVYFLVEADPS